MKKVLVLIAVLGAALALTAAADGQTLGEKWSITPLSHIGVSTPHSARVTMAPANTWAQASSNFQGELINVNGGLSGPLLEVGIFKPGPTAPGFDDCGVSQNRVRAIFVEWSSNTGGAPYHCNWFDNGGVGIPNNEYHVIEIAQCTANDYAWCAFDDGVQLGNAHDIGMNPDTYPAYFVNIGTEQGFEQHDAIDTAHFKRLQASGGDSGNEVWHYMVDSDACEFNPDDAFLFTQIAGDATTVMVYYASNAGPADTC